MSSEARSESNSNGLGNIRTWLREARGGSRESLGRALESCRGYLKVMAVQKLPRKLRAKESLSDLVQRTLQQAARDFAAFRGNGGGEFKAWLHTILRTQALTVHRHFTTGTRAIDREVSLNEGDESGDGFVQPIAKGPGPLEEILKREDIAALKQAMLELEPRERKIIEIFRHSHGVDYSESIGNELGISASAARSRLYRALLKLKDRLKARHGE